MPPWSFRVWGPSKFPEGRWSIERFIDSIVKPRDLLSLDPCFFGWKNGWGKFCMMRFYEMYILCFFLCNRHVNSYFVVKPHGGGFLLKCRFTRVTLLSPNFQRIFFWKPSFWVETPATRCLEIWWGLESIDIILPTKKLSYNQRMFDDVWTNIHSSGLRGENRYISRLPTQHHTAI